jgi:hypothetical protein
MLADELLRQERAHGMADEKQREPRMVGGDLAIELPDIVEEPPPAVALSEKTEIGRCRLGKAVAAVIAGIDRVAGAGQRLREPRITPGMLRQPMDDLNRRLRRRLRQPAIGEERDGIRRAQGSGRRLHVGPRVWNWLPPRSRRRT